MQGALSCIVLGSLTRLILLVLMPTSFGIENTLLYVPNSIFTTEFDGFPTLISPLVGLVAFIIVSGMTYKNKISKQRVQSEEREAEVYQS